MPAIPLMLLVDGRQTESRRVQPAAGFGRMRNAAKRFHRTSGPRHDRLAKKITERGVSNTGT